MGRTEIVVEEIVPQKSGGGGRRGQTSLAQWGGRGGGQKSQGSEENGLHDGRIDWDRYFFCFLDFSASNYF